MRECAGTASTENKRVRVVATRVALRADADGCSQNCHGLNNRAVILLLIAMTDGSVSLISSHQLTKCLPTLAKGAAGTYGVFLYEGPLVNGVVRKLLGAS